MSDLEQYERLTNHVTLARHHAREADKLVADLVAQACNVTHLARWAHVSRPTIYKMAERGRAAHLEDQLPGIGR